MENNIAEKKSEDSRTYTENEEISIKTKSKDYEKLGKNIYKVVGKKKISKIIVRDDSLVVYTSKGHETLHKILDLVDSKDLEQAKLSKPDMSEVFEKLTRGKIK